MRVKHAHSRLHEDATYTVKELQAMLAATEEERARLELKMQQMADSNTEMAVKEVGWQQALETQQAQLAA